MLPAASLTHYELRITNYELRCSEQSQFLRPLNRLYAVVDIQFAIDALDVGAYRVRGDEELVRDLRGR